MSISLDSTRPLLRRAIAVLAITQLIGWGTTFFSPAVLAGVVTRDLNIERETVFAGISIMLAIGGAVGPIAGRLIDRIGARPFMAFGSLLGAVATAMLALAQGPISWLAAWVLVGAMLPLALGTAAFTAIAQLSGERSRRAITTLTLFSALSATLFWPITGWLEAMIGWRATYLVFSALNLLVCLPLHLWALPARRLCTLPAGAPRVDTGELPPERRRAAFLAFALATSAQGFVGWGLSLHLPHLLESLGLAAATALIVASLGGPAQIAGRGIDILAEGRIHPLGLAIASVAIAPLAFLILMSGGALAAAVAFILILAATNGMMTICRATVPLTLYGRTGYGALLGRLSLPQNLMFASAPLVFAWVMSAGGPRLALMMAFGIAIVALGAMLLLARIAKVPLIVRGTR